MKENIQLYPFKVKKAFILLQHKDTDTYTLGTWKYFLNPSRNNCYFEKSVFSNESQLQSPWAKQ
jgi:hypothetical protein